MEKREPSYTVGGNANYGEECGDSLKKLEIELPYDSVPYDPYANPTAGHIHGGNQN